MGAWILGTEECDALFPSDHKMENGMFYVSDAPGLGVDFDENEAKRYSFDRRYHPIVRLEDGQCGTTDHGHKH